MTLTCVKHSGDEIGWRMKTQKETKTIKEIRTENIVKIKNWQCGMFFGEKEFVIHLEVCQNFHYDPTTFQ